MMQSFYTAVSGLNGNKQWLDVISDNIANVNTIGYKSERVTFQDLVARSLTTFGNNVPKNIEIGGGSFVAVTTKDFSQGSFQTTNIPLDLALDGEGFFMVKGLDGVQYYTRAGQFRLDANGDIVNVDGLRLQGWKLDENGNIAGALGSINIPYAIEPKGTTKLALKEPTNLDSRLNIINREFNPSDPTTYSYVNTIAVYDSLGNEHQLSMYFRKIGDGVWEIFSFVDDEPIRFSGNNFTTNDTNTYASLIIDFDSLGNVENIRGNKKIQDPSSNNITLNPAGSGILTNTPVLPGSVAVTHGTRTYLDDGKGNLIYKTTDAVTGKPKYEIVGSIRYDNGEITLPGRGGDSITVSYQHYTAGSSTNTAIPPIIRNIPITLENNTGSLYVSTGASPLQIDFNFRNLKQVASDFIFYAAQDGYGKGDLLGVSITEDGVIKGMYSNGQVKDHARLGVATFKDKEMLVRKGTNLYLPNTQTYTPIITPGGVLSKVRSGFLELSNVDISREFINLIIAQRAYQANARVITTDDQILQEAMNIKR